MCNLGTVETTQSDVTKHTARVHSKTDPCAFCCYSYKSGNGLKLVLQLLHVSFTNGYKKFI